MSPETRTVLALGLSQETHRAGQIARNAGDQRAALRHRTMAVVIFDRVLTRWSHSATARNLNGERAAR